jgi:hypothetical protein
MTQFSRSDLSVCRNSLSKNPMCLTAGLALVMLAVLACSILYSRRVDAQGTRARFEQDLGQVFTAHEEISLDPRVIAAQVRASGRVSLATSSHDFEIQLRPNDLRAPNYRAEETGVGGITREIAMPAISTYKGNLADVWGSDARFTVNDDRFEGMIVTSGDAYFIESAQKFSNVAQPTDYVVYRPSDVRADIVRTCATTLEEQVTSGASEFMSNASTGISPSVFSPFKIVEIATDADLEYTNALGGSANANNDILGIMNQVQAIYERDIGLTFTVTSQHTWTTADPYGAGGNGAVAVLNAFTNYWNANFSATPRDVAHLWTGKNLGGPNGIAWMGVVCRDAAASYGISDLETMAPFRVGIPAHEIGHNFNASHSDGQAGCDNTIMLATQTQSNNLTFCAFSVNEITAYVNANPGCLTNAPAGNPIDTVDFFVRQHYTDFLGRPADQAGLDFWSRQITDCGANAPCVEVRRINVSASFFLSIEFQTTGYLVERTYKTAYADTDGTSTFQGNHTLKVPVVRFNEFIADTRQVANNVIVGQGDWQGTLETNKVAYFNAFVQTPRFTTAYPTNMLPATYVSTLNNNAGSPLSPAELATLTAEHTTGQKNRAQVLRQIAEHQNLQASEFNRAFVLMEYFGYLRRNPNDAPESTRDYTGYDFWLTKLNQFNGNYINAEMVKAFLSSTEYRQRFGTP